MAEKKTTSTTARKRTTSTAAKKNTTTAIKKASVKIQELKEEPTEVLESKNAEIEALKEQTKQLQEMLKSQTAQPRVEYVQVSAKDRVHFLWLADVANDNSVEFGPNGMYGRIVGKTGTFFVPKEELSRLLDSATRHYMELRWLIVISGLDEEEREALGINYKEGEILDVQTFRKIADLDKETLVEVYKNLCDSHRDMVASRFHEEFENGKWVNRDTIITLNKIAPSKAFKDIIEQLNKRDLKGEQ